MVDNPLYVVIFQIQRNYNRFAWSYKNSPGDSGEFFVLILFCKKFTDACGNCFCFISCSLIFTIHIILKIFSRDMLVFGLLKFIFIFPGRYAESALYEVYHICLFCYFFYPIFIFVSPISTRSIKDIFIK